MSALGSCPFLSQKEELISLSRMILKVEYFVSKLCSRALAMAVVDILQKLVNMESLVVLLIINLWGKSD